MHIGIDAHAIGSKQGGNETYIRNLIMALAEIDSHNRYTIYFSRREAAGQWTGRYPNFEVRLLPPPTPLVRVPIALSIELRRRPVDLLHVQYTAPPWCPVPLVTTIHDLAFEHFPETFTRRGSMQLRLTVRRAAKRAARVATVSEFSRADLIATYHLSPAKVVVTPNGVESHFSPQAASPDEGLEVRRQFGISRDFILAVGSLQPRKNLLRLLNAYGLLRAEMGERAPQLVIVGRRLWLYRGILDEIARQGWAHDVIVTDYVSEKSLPELYRAAKVFVYPSLFEGFGLPPLEAMACGTPVVTSSTSSLPEVVGDAAILIDPYDEGALAQAMVRAMTEESLRLRLRAAGLEQAKKFTWKVAAEKTLRLYHESVDEFPR
ncbi:MAG: glycosyltransferase family 1 protein [Acidobacteriota bacterium]